MVAGQFNNINWTWTKMSQNQHPFRLFQWILATLKQTRRFEYRFCKYAKSDCEPKTTMINCVSENLIKQEFPPLGRRKLFLCAFQSPITEVIRSGQEN
jgi:hypothetical protein